MQSEEKEDGTSRLTLTDFSTVDEEAGETAQESRAFTVHIEDPNLVPAPGDLTLSSSLHEYQHTHDMYSHRYTYLEIKIYFKNRILMYPHKKHVVLYVYKHELLKATANT